MIRRYKAAATFSVATLFFAGAAAGGELVSYDEIQVQNYQGLNSESTGKGFSALSGSLREGEKCVEVSDLIAAASPTFPAGTIAANEDVAGAITGTKSILPGVTQDFFFDFADTEEELTSLQGAYFTARIGGYGGGGSFAHQSHRFQKQTYLVVRNIIRLPQTSATIRLKDWAQKLIQEGKTQEFYDRCGTHYIARTSMSAEFSAVFAATYIGEEERNSLDGYLKARWIGGSAAAGYSSSSISTRTKNSIKLVSGGIGIANTQVDTTVEGVATYAKNFAELVRVSSRNSSAGKGASPFIVGSAVAVPYQGLNFRPQLRNMQRIFALATELADYRDKLQAILENDPVLGWVTQLPASLQNSNGEVDKSEVMAEQKRVNNAIADVQEAADTCNTTPTNCTKTLVDNLAFEKKKIEFVGWKVLNLDQPTYFGSVGIGQEAWVRSEGSVIAGGDGIGPDHPIPIADTFYIYIRAATGKDVCWVLGNPPQPITDLGSLRIQPRPFVEGKVRRADAVTPIAAVLIKNRLPPMAPAVPNHQTCAGN